MDWKSQPETVRLFIGKKMDDFEKMVRQMIVFERAHKTHANNK